MVKWSLIWAHRKRQLILNSMSENDSKERSAIELEKWLTLESCKAVDSAPTKVIKLSAVSYLNGAV